MKTLVSLIGVEPFRIGGNESFLKELSLQIQPFGWRHVICTISEPTPGVRAFLDLPNVSFETISNVVLSDLAATRAAARLFIRHRPSIVHLHFVGFISAYPWLACLCGAEKVFFTDQTSPAEQHIPVRVPRWKRMASRCVTWPLNEVICVSDYGRSCLLATGVYPAGRVRRIYNAVDLERVGQASADGSAFRRKYGISEGAPIVLQVSWLIREKGIVDLINAAVLVVERYPGVQFVIVGEGAFRDEFRSLAEKKGLGDHIRFTGLIDDPVAEGAFAAAHVVCQMSRWQEVFGWVIAEAMAFGKPLVATRVGGIPEVVDDGMTGYLVDRGDSAAMADRIILLLGDPALRQRMGQAGRAAVEQRFNLRENIRELLVAYGIARR